MPLKKGKENLSFNIQELMHKGKSQQQAIAISMRVAGVSKPKHP